MNIQKNPDNFISLYILKKKLL